MSDELRQLPRIPLLTPDEWGDEERNALAAFSEPLSKLGLDGDMQALARLPNVLNTLLRNPALMAVYFPLAHYLLHDGLLDARTRELLILRTAWLRQSEYEWAQHVLKGREAGISDDEIQRIAAGSDDPEWEPHEALLVRAVDELVAHGCISDSTWQGLSDRLDNREMMELVFTVGGYDMAAMAFNSFGLQLDEGLPGFAALKPASNDLGGE